MPCYQCDGEDLAEIQANRAAEIRAYHDNLQREADEAVGLNSKGFNVAFLELPPQEAPEYKDPEFVNDWKHS